MNKISKELLKIAREVNKLSYKIEPKNISIMFLNPYTNVGSYDPTDSIMELKLNFIVNFAWEDVDMIEQSSDKEKQFKKVESLYHKKTKNTVQLILRNILNDIENIYGVKDIDFIFKLNQCGKQQIGFDEFFDTTGFSCTLGIKTIQIQNVPTYIKFTRKIVNLLQNKYDAQDCMI